MPSLQARLFDLFGRLVVRRRHWGDGPRAVSARARRVFGAPRPFRWLAASGVRITRVDDGPVHGEWLSVARPHERFTLLYVHGGGYLSCSPATHRGVTAPLARALGCRVFAVDYRLAPEAPFPAALEDAVAAYRWLAAGGPPVALAGESAGGGLVLLIAQQARDRGWPAPLCVASLSPWTDLTGAGASMTGNAGRDVMFHPQNVRAFAAAYLAGAPADDPRASPLHGNAAGLPPVLFQVGDTELLLDDARRMHERILAAGGASRLSVYEGAAHGWHLVGPVLPEARRAVAEIAVFVGSHAAGRA
jgi:monoterpene epsilon-lactone hydrolase